MTAFFAGEAFLSAFLRAATFLDFADIFLDNFFAYFFAAPVALFLVISVITYALTGERKKKEKNASVVTSID